MRLVKEIVLGFLPLALAPLFFWLIGEGYWDLGGGEKDVILVLVWCLFSVIYLIAFGFCCIKRMTLVTSVLVAITTSLIILASIALWLRFY